MKKTSFAKYVIGGIVGTVMTIGSIGSLDYLLTSRHKLKPGETAIVREVFQKQGALFGPSSVPYKVRIVENGTEKCQGFIIQPWPFGTIEEILEKDEVKEIEAKGPLWTKNHITKNASDENIARVYELKGKFKIDNAELYAKVLDHQRAYYFSGGRDFFSDRRDVLSKTILGDFGKYVVEEVGKLENNLSKKCSILMQEFMQNNLKTEKEKRQYLNRLFEENPWYRIKDEAGKKILEEYPEIAEEFMRVQTTGKWDIEKIRKFFIDYIKEHPEIDEKEMWDHALDYAIEGKAPLSTVEGMRDYVCPFVEKHFDKIKEGYLKQLHESEIEKSAGVKVTDLSIDIIEEPAYKYPSLLEKK